MTYTPRRIAAWYEQAQRNRLRELREQFMIARTAAHGDKQACQKLIKALGR